MIHPKVAVAGGGAFGGAELGAQIAGIVIWILTAHGVDVPKEQISNITGITSAVVGGILALVGGWFTPSPANVAPTIVTP